MKFYLFIPFFTFIFSCKSDSTTVELNSTGETIRSRVLAPQGYEWMDENSNSFGEFLQNCKLKKAGSKIVDFQNKPIANQYEHVAVLDYDIGTKDLQQCADAVIRLHAEYLYAHKRFDEIAYHFTNGDIYKWNDYKKGIRSTLKGTNKVVFEKKAEPSDGYTSFRKYLDIVFMYAGTISLTNETIKVTKNENIKSGDVLITPGSPGHAVIIVGRAKNKQGKIVYSLAQGYTPAQSIHVLTNPYSGTLNPWYDLDVDSNPTITARYTFLKTNIRTFK
jgi:hypothetical protein